MTYPSRIALGSIQPAADLTPMLWALIGMFRSHARQVQVFHDQARFLSGERGRVICGVNSRYLDSWLMSPPLCRESYAFGARGCDLALVCGRFASARPSGEAEGGNLEDLCQWLDLPALAVVDVSELNDCRLPDPPDTAVGVLLDRVEQDELSRWQTTLEALWGLPVLGALPELPHLRAKMRDGLPSSDSPCEFCAELAHHLGSTTNIGKLIGAAPCPMIPADEPQIFRAGRKLAGLTVAVAYDDALDCYFPDVLDLLELHGANVRDFSPLRDENLPSGADIVYLGCGHPESHAEALAHNECMILALHNHLRLGRRIYAEAGGLAYLCESIVMPTGEPLPMAGVLPAKAIHLGSVEPHPVEVTASRDHWLGTAGAKLRGYLNSPWAIVPAGRLDELGCDGDGHRYLVGRQQAVGSRLHINFAAQPQFLDRFSSSSARAVC